MAISVIPHFQPDSPATYKQLIEQYRQIPASTLGHLTTRGYLSGIRSQLTDNHMAGSVVTVKVFPPDAGAIREALLLSQAGDVLVIECAHKHGDAYGDGVNPIDYACWGELRNLAAQIKALAGVIVAGPVTDIQALRKHHLPVFATGVSALTTRTMPESTGEVNGSIQVAGVEIQPGDIAVGDDDGVFILSPQHAEELLPLALDKECSDECKRQELLSKLL